MSSIMLLVNKELPSSYLGRGNNNTYSTSSKLHKGFAKKESDFCLGMTAGALSSNV